MFAGRRRVVQHLLLRHVATLYHRHYHRRDHLWGEVSAKPILQQAPNRSVYTFLRRHGLDTLSQLVTMDRKTWQFTVHVMTVQDYPRFSHRGLLIGA